MATGAHDVSQTLPRVAACGSLRMLKTLLAVPGVNVNARLRAPGCPFDGATALHCCVSSYEPRLDHVHALLEAGVDVNSELPCGLRPCDVVNHSQTRRMLASHGGAHAPYQNTASRSAFRAAQSLLVALQNCNFTDMRRAISEGASVHTTDMMGNSALHRAVLTGSAADVVWLMQSGACLSGQCWSGDTPLHLAVSSRDQKMLELLLAAGADPLIENAHGCCCVRLAARMANVAAWEALTTHISARRCAESAPPAEGIRSPRPGVRWRLTRTRPPPGAPPLSADELQRREAAAEAVAAELIADRFELNT